MRFMQKKVGLFLGGLALTLVVQQAYAAIALDRTRVIYNGSQKSMSVTVTNQNKSLPYLAQSWIEDSDGVKTETSFMALPPVQRVEPGAKGQVKIQGNNTQALPQDRESLFYFNVREIPPKSTKPNTLQLALQTRIKLFYRPEALQLQNGMENDAAQKLTLTHQGDGFQLNNSTAYYLTIVAAASSENGSDIATFKPVMVAPKESITLGATAASLGAHPVLTSVNDYGGRPKLIFNCAGNTCTVSHVKAGQGESPVNGEAFYRYSRKTAWILVLGGCITCDVQAADGGSAQGTDHQLHIHGVMRNGSCLLSMRTQWQEVVMDNSALGEMKRPGDTGKPTQLVFRLLGCERTGGLKRTNKTGPSTWDEVQPAVTVSFIGVADPDDPTLLRIAGMSGVGLRILNNAGRAVIPGTRGRPQLVTPGDDELTYTVIPVRTTAPLIAGEFRASVEFGISYD